PESATGSPAADDGNTACTRLPASSTDGRAGRTAPPGAGTRVAHLPANGWWLLLPLNSCGPADTKQVIVDATVACYITLHRLRHHGLHFLRQHAEVESAVVIRTAELRQVTEQIKIETGRMAADTDYVGLAAGIGHHAHAYVGAAVVSGTPAIAR